MRNNKGFSLVELIVVIAIMAVLAAVAVIGVSIYIPKAQAQADISMLDTLSDSFAAACLSAGVNPKEVEASVAIVDGTLKLDGSGMVDLKISGNASDSQKAEIKQLFNETVKSTTVSFNMPDGARDFIKAVNGRFDFADAGVRETVKGNYDYGTIEISKEDKNAFLGTAFDEMGMEYLMGQMNGVIEYASNYEGLLANVVEDDDFKALRNSMYPEYDDATPEEQKKMNMQVLVLYTAQRSEIDAETLYNHICQNPGAYIGTDKTGNAEYEWRDTDGKAFAANGAMYGLALAFAESTEGAAAIAEMGTVNGEPFDKTNPDHIRKLMTYHMDKTHPEDPTFVIGKEEEIAFGKWLKDNKEDSIANINGFQAAMGMLSDNKDNLDADMLLQDGYANGSLVDCLESLLGSN